MGYNLFLDDLRNPEDCFGYTKQPAYLMEDWLIVRDYDEFVRTIKELGIPKVISLDHDLADFHYKEENQKTLTDEVYDNMGEKTGYHCAKWLCDYCVDNKVGIPKAILVHSMNVVGAENIRSLFMTFIKVLYGK